MMCDCDHDVGVFGHQPPCPYAPSPPSRIYVDKQTGQGFVIIATRGEA